ncbi:MAG: M55 family metallopeptidase [Oceanospirillaceae bacterium]
MKVFISADIEGVAGITHWDEAAKAHSDYSEFRQQMTTETVAACEAALDCGATEIFVKDAHGTGRNIIASQLPDSVTLIRGWSGHPYCMVQEIDESFDALIMVGYHSKAGDNGNPLAHTLAKKIDYISINGVRASEFLIHQYAAALENVPVVFVSGDKGICNEAKAANPYIETLALLEGKGASTICMNPKLALEKMTVGVTKALSANFDNCAIELPDNFEVEIKYLGPVYAYQASFYPGASLSQPQAIRFNSDDYFEVLRLLRFVV